MVPIVEPTPFSLPPVYYRGISLILPCHHPFPSDLATPRRTSSTVSLTRNVPSTLNWSFRRQSPPSHDVHTDSPGRVLPVPTTRPTLRSHPSGVLHKTHVDGVTFHTFTSTSYTSTPSRVSSPSCVFGSSLFFPFPLDVCVSRNFQNAKGIFNTTSRNGLTDHKPVCQLV